MTELKNVDLDEVKKFASRADNWWNLDGEFKTLHEINLSRLKFIMKNKNIQHLFIKYKQ